MSTRFAFVSSLSGIFRKKKPVAEATKMAKLMDCREKEDKKVWDALEKLGDEVAAAVGPRPGVGVVIQHP